jgi:hypothetical protein
MTAGEACGLLVDKTRECAVITAERDEARTWLRAALRCLINQNRQIDRLREDLRRERQMHGDLRAAVLERAEAA